VAHFYGWTDDYIQSMPFSRYVKYLLSIDAIQAKAFQVQKNLHMYPNLKKSGRDKLDRFFKSIYNRLVKKSTAAKPTPRAQALAIAKRFTNGR
jgi:hypothetical protein